MTARSCLVSTCAQPVEGNRRMCPEHWRQVPGRLRSQLSFNARSARSAIGDQVWERARAAIESMPA